VNHEILLADILGTIHLAFVAFVVIGQVLILVGWLLGWGWIRNFWFRLIHLLSIGVVALQGAAGSICPLTSWEHTLRKTHHDHDRAFIALEMWATGAETPATAPWTLCVQLGRCCQLGDEYASSLRYVDGSSRIGTVANRILFYEGGEEEMKWFQRGHMAFGVLVLATFFLVLPRLPRWRKSPSPATASPLP
jgi:hypothetical protein